MAIFPFSSSHLIFLTQFLLFLSFSPRLTYYNMSQTNVYIPRHAFGEIHIQSILNITPPLLNDDEPHRKFDYHHSRRTMLYFLLAMKSTPDNQELMELIHKCQPKLDWTRIQHDYEILKKRPEPYQAHYRAENVGIYWELKYFRLSGPIQAGEYISKYRQNGFELNELKLYWNYEQIRTLNQNDRYNPTTDSDTHDALQKFPVDTREHDGRINFVISGIEEAVFQVPQGKQIIVLDFADERMPGGYFLENARTQEEVILYNSDGYRAILDLKYKMMDGGYALPELGVAYVKQVKFFQKGTKQERTTDLIIAACYDLSGIGEGLYKAPAGAEPISLRDRTLQKFQAIIGAAVANTEGNGQDTYLLLGPIGTGAFNNGMKMIAELFSQVLNSPLMDSKKAIRHAFKEIWFVSIDDLSIFQKEFDQ